jgi:hypothetical protein
MVRSIHGFFFQERLSFDVRHRAEVDGGVGVIIQSGLMRDMFAGFIFPRELDLIGRMADPCGESELSNIMISVARKEMSFTKKYLKRADTIDYSFKLVGEIWVGGYEGNAVGAGGATCIITEVPDKLFLPPNR